MLLAAVELINFDPIFKKLNSKKKKRQKTAKPTLIRLLEALGGFISQHPTPGH